MKYNSFMILLADKWNDYQLIDAGDKDKLERWNNVILVRPDPQAIWHRRELAQWKKYDAIYHRSNKGGGNWEFRKQLPEYWTVSYRDLKFKVSPTNFKHTGLFPEQAVNWDWMAEKVRNSDHPVKALNLFGYTGDLRGMTQGRAASSMELFAYEEVPPNVSQEIIEKRNSKE